MTSKEFGVLQKCINFPIFQRDKLILQNKVSQMDLIFDSISYLKVPTRQTKFIAALYIFDIHYENQKVDFQIVKIRKV